MCYFKKGFTLTEVVVTLAVIAVLAGAGSWMLVFLIDNFVYLPPRIAVDTAVSDSLNLIAEGDHKAQGLRFARSFKTINPDQVEFTDSNDNDVRFRLFKGSLYRRVNNDSEETLPYYADSIGLSFSGPGGGVIFTYYDAQGNPTANATLVKHINISLIGQDSLTTRQLKTGVSLRP
jgi:prepilin-type N-terminal cleavage/methylation domain-containing protein